MSHRRRVPSALADHRRLPSSENATAFTPASCPCNSRPSPPFIGHIPMVPSQLAEATRPDAAASPATLPLWRPITWPGEVHMRTVKSSPPEITAPSANITAFTAASWPSSQCGAVPSQSPTALSKLAVAIRSCGDTAIAITGPPCPLSEKKSPAQSGAGARMERNRTSAARMGYSAGVALVRPASFALTSSTQRLWCSRAHCSSTSPVPIASKAPSIPTEPR